MEGMDWVKARAACSLPRIFEALGEQLERDVASANALNRPNVLFRFNRERHNSMSVSRRFDYAGIPQGQHVVFALGATEIAVEDVDAVGKKRSLFTARPVLTVEGDCRLELSGDPQPKELWQVSRKALEDLFFSFE